VTGVDPIGGRAGNPVSGLDGDTLCRMVGRGMIEQLTITTTVTPAEADTAKAALDAYLVSDGETVANEPVERLGEAAGFAGSKLDVRSGGSQLAVIGRVRDTVVEVVTKVEPPRRGTNFGRSRMS
jgi:hypothetical protein